MLASEDTVGNKPNMALAIEEVAFSHGDLELPWF